MSGDEDETLDPWRDIVSDNQDHTVREQLREHNPDNFLTRQLTRGLGEQEPELLVVDSDNENVRKQDEVLCAPTV